mmetsp:Transcript_6520/g.12291  ORF Transcript_6520/g.12291 Transcript_6520/m.12291 type:complete len:140 (-) Transcript_6520:276-695(-)
MNFSTLIKNILLLLTITKLDACAPTNDSVLAFRFEQEVRTCVWVAADPAKRCVLQNDIAGSVSSHCPFTCNVNTCVNLESNMYFPVLLGKNGATVYKWKKCPWINENEFKHCANRCARPGIAETCQVQCALCAAQITLG